MTQMSRSEQDIKTSMKSVLKAESLPARELPASAREAVADLLSHDLKTPLIGSSQLISLILAGSAGELNPELVRLLKLIQQTNFEVLDLVQGVLEIYRYDGDGENITFEQIDLYELSTVVQETLEQDAQSSPVEIEVFQADPPVYACADRRAALQAVTMLASQLLRARCGCTKLHIKTRAANAKAMIELFFVGLCLPVDCLQLFSGELKPEKAVSHAFKPAKFAMHAARQIIAATNGSIECSMLKDKNSLLLEIFLPLC